MMGPIPRGNVDWLFLVLARGRSTNSNLEKEGALRIADKSGGFPDA
jgi:hypothetical protein